MILKDIRDFIKSRSMTSLTELSQQFNKSADDLLPLLAYWQAKGCIECVSSSGCGQGACANCPMRCSTLYRYVVA